MSKLVEQLNVIRDCQTSITKAKSEMEEADREIKSLLGDVFSTDLKRFLDDKLYENLPPETRKKIEEKSESEEKPYDSDKGYIHATYSIDPIFNPKKDRWETSTFIYNEDKTKVKITAECIKMRQSLGCTGFWIPSLYSTDWIDIKELEEKENNKTNIFN